MLASPVCAQKYDLKLNLKAGDKARMTMVVDEDITQEITGKKTPVQQHLEMGMATEVLSADGGVYTVKLTFARIAMNTKMPQATTTFDSDKDTTATANPATGMLRALVGSELTVTFTDRGKVTNLKGFDKLTDKMLGAVANVSPKEMDHMKTMINEQFGEKSLKETFGRMTDTLPDGPVAIGDSWTRKVEVASGVPMIVESTYTLTGKEGDTYLIEDKGTISSALNSKPVQVSGTTLSYDMKGAQSGTIRFQPTRLMSEGNIHQTMEGKMGVKTATQDIKIPMTVMSDIVMRPGK